MKRRNLGLMAGSTMLAVGLPVTARAQTAADPSLLKTTLTPTGAERAGNADGTIPTWTGGYNSSSPGWTGAAPDFILNEKPILVINAENAAQHRDKLSDGVMLMMVKFGYSIKVYPTHRTFNVPEYVQDNSALNVTRTMLSPAGPRYGFENAYGGFPFPIPDQSDPFKAGAQIILNHTTRYKGYCATNYIAAYAVNDGNVVFASGVKQIFKSPYYDPNGSIETWNGNLYKVIFQAFAPSYSAGITGLSFRYSDASKQRSQLWAVLAGQGRIRKLPNGYFDTPQTLVNGDVDDDEISGGFNGELFEYNWKLLGKKEMYIPYHTNLILNTPTSAFVQPKFCNPEITRWELHRCWVVEATLAEGYHNTLARRIFYIDEDSWAVGVGDCYDAQNNLFHVEIPFSFYDSKLETDVTYTASGMGFNVQTGDYGMWPGVGGGSPYNTPTETSNIPDEVFTPDAVAAQSSY